MTAPLHNGSMRSGLGLAELAERVERKPALLSLLLSQLEAAGRVVQVDGGWRLSDEAEREFGYALRHMASKEYA